LKKIYTIEITETERKSIWYANKIGQQYEGELFSSRDSTSIVFQINPCQFVHITDCKVISERIVQPYHPKFK